MSSVIRFFILTCVNRHFFFTAMLFVYGRILSQRLVSTVTSDKFLYQLVSSVIKYQMVICYSLYIAGWLSMLSLSFYIVVVGRRLLIMKACFNMGFT